jgi:hypothetical protein
LERPETAAPSTRAAARRGGGALATTDDELRDLVQLAFEVRRRWTGWTRRTVGTRGCS